MDAGRGLIKRILDVELALLALILLGPLMLGIAILVRMRDGAPVLFAQERPGRHERPFRILKFRTMTDAVDADGALKPNAQRITPLGRFLRASSLDELPELINVLRGEMSLVGPRPLVTAYLPHYRPEERLRHAVRPGITGLAQVAGRNALSWNAKMARDLQYVRGFTLWLDAWILLRTIRAVFRPGSREVGPEGGDAFPTTMQRPPLKHGGPAR